MSAELTSLLPGEQEALQQSAVAGGPGTKPPKPSTSSAADGPVATSTPATLKSLSKKKHAQPVCSVLWS